MDPKKDYYRILGVPEGASAEEIRKDLEKLAQVQNVPVPEEPEEPEPAEEITDEIRALLESEDEGLGQMLNQFNTTARRERIERALAPLDVQDIIMHREMRQTVPVSCGVEVHFRTINGHESMQLLRYLGEQLSKSDTDLYIQELFANLRLAASTRGIGDMVFDHHMDARVLNKQRLQDKLDVILDYPQELLADMRVNCAWFALRVQRAMLGKALKNG